MDDSKVPIRWVLPDPPLPTARVANLLRNEQRVVEWLSYLGNEELKSLHGLVITEGERRGFGPYWGE